MGVKVCTECGVEKDEGEFAPNQYGKNNRLLRRPVCRECYAKKVKPNPEQKKLFEQKNPKPKLGVNFTCPICNRTFKRKFSNDVVLDHSHVDGTIRGWLCSSCNTSLGKFKDDVSILQRAINWILRKK